MLRNNTLYHLDFFHDINLLQRLRFDVVQVSVCLYRRSCRGTGYRFYQLLIKFYIIDTLVIAFLTRQFDTFLLIHSMTDQYRSTIIPCLFNSTGSTLTFVYYIIHSIYMYLFMYHLPHCFTIFTFYYFFTV